MIKILVSIYRISNDHFQAESMKLSFLSTFLSNEKQMNSVFTHFLANELRFFIHFLSYQIFYILNERLFFCDLLNITNSSLGICYTFEQRGIFTIRKMLEKCIKVWAKGDFFNGRKNNESSSR